MQPGMHGSLPFHPVTATKQRGEAKRIKIYHMIVIKYLIIRLTATNNWSKLLLCSRFSLPTFMVSIAFILIFPLLKAMNMVLVKLKSIASKIV